MAPLVVAIVGTSDSGKTRVAVALIQLLVGQGYRIAAVKHCPHGHQVDRSATDSRRLFAAGAARIVLSSPGQMTSIERTEADIPLEGIIASFDSSYDLVVAEGFKDSTAPKVLVLGAEEVSPWPQNVMAVVGEDSTAHDAPCYSFQQLDKLAREIRNRVLQRATYAPTVSLVVDGVSVPLARFPARALAGVIHGFLSSLKDVPPCPQRVRLRIDR